MLRIPSILCVPALSQTRAEDWTAIGLALAQQGKYDEAIKIFDEAVQA